MGSTVNHGHTLAQACAPPSARPQAYLPHMGNNTPCLRHMHLHAGPGAGSKGLSAAGLGQGHSARPAAAPPAGLRAELDLRKAHSAGASACAWEQGGSALERKLEPVLEGSEERLTGSKSGLNGSRLLSFLKSQQSVAEEALGHLQAE